MIVEGEIGFLINYKTKSVSNLYQESKSFINLNYIIAEEFIEGEQYSTETIIYNNNFFTPGFVEEIIMIQKNIIHI